MLSQCKAQWSEAHPFPIQQSSCGNLRINFFVPDCLYLHIPHVATTPLQLTKVLICDYASMYMQCCAICLCLLACTNALDAMCVPLPPQSAIPHCTNIIWLFKEFFVCFLVSVVVHSSPLALLGHASGHFCCLQMFVEAHSSRMALKRILKYVAEHPSPQLCHRTRAMSICQCCICVWHFFWRAVFRGQTVLYCLTQYLPS